MYIVRGMDTEKTIVYNIQCGNIIEVIDLLNILKEKEDFIIEGVFRNDNVVYINYEDFRREHDRKQRPISEII